MKEKIDHYIEVLSTLTKEEANFAEQIIYMPDEDKSAFIFAKRIFEEHNANRDKKINRKTRTSRREK